MPFRNMKQGIEAIQSGNKAEGARLLKIALRSDELKGSLRATAYLWLAETKDDPQQKMAFYNDALVADPDNEHARQRISQLLSKGLPPVPGNQTEVAPDPAPPAASPPPNTVPMDGTTPIFGMQAIQDMPAQQVDAIPAQSPQYFGNPPKPTGGPRASSLRYNPDAIYRTVGVRGGPNGRGTAFFITRDGLLATSRFVVGGETQIVIEFEEDNVITGQVVRAFPEHDLAFIHTGLKVNRLPQTYNVPTIPAQMPLTALAHNRRAMSGQVRQTKSVIKPDWFPTTIDQLNDSGGNPVYNDHNILVGMLTHNTNSSSDLVYGVNINTIYRFVEHYAQEAHTAGGQLTYCPGCGYLSRATSVGGFYCEICGSILPQAENMHRSPMPQLSGFYGETRNRPCGNCNSRVGNYDGRCLRCGHMALR